MILRHVALALVIALTAASARAQSWGESPMLALKVETGDLPPVAERLPETPLEVAFDDWRELGRYGGSLTMAMGQDKDIRMMVVYGYARLVGYNEDLELVPDILLDLENERNRVFTLHLRPGHKWSDGHPFTAEDFRYYWEDVATHEKLSPFGPPRDLLVDGQPPEFEVIDDHTVRYTYPEPHPTFVSQLAGASPRFLYRPAHYLKQFHAEYTPIEELNEKVIDAGARGWEGLHNRLDNQYKFNNIHLPTLQPWVNTVEPPSQRFVFDRNPYFHRVDPKGRQLPYIDRVIMNVSDSGLVAAQTGAGDSDLQARYLRFDNYTFLREGEERNNYDVRLWKRVTGSQVALYPNLNAQDEVWREVLRDVRFRRALSLGVDREEINEVIYFGLTHPSNNTLIPESPLYREEYAEKWAEYDPERANALLDEMGLERGDDGVRRLPDGRKLEIVVETAGESTEETDVLELIRYTWRKLGIRLYSKPSQREVFRNRVYSGRTLLSVWSGVTNGVATANMSPWEFAPTSQDQLQWPMYGQYWMTGGEAGREPDMPVARELLGLYEDWVEAGTEEEREEIWHEMLSINADQVLTIGTVNQSQQPVIVRNTLRNVPEKGIYNWDPGAYFGIYKPDTFWFDE